MPSFVSIIFRWGRWLRLGIGLSLLLIGCFAGVVLAQRAQKQYVAVGKIESLGGSVMYDFETQGRAQPPGPRWLRSLIGDDYFRRVEVVMFWNANTGNTSLRHVQSLKKIKKLFLDGTQVTDAGLSHLEHLKNLQFLSLRETSVTEDAVAKLRKKLPACWIR